MQCDEQKRTLVDTCATHILRVTRNKRIKIDLFALPPLCSFWQQRLKYRGLLLSLFINIFVLPPAISLLSSFNNSSYSTTNFLFSFLRCLFFYLTSLYPFLLHSITVSLCGHWMVVDWCVHQVISWSSLFLHTRHLGAPAATTRARGLKMPKTYTHASLQSSYLCPLCCPFGCFVDSFFNISPFLAGFQWIQWFQKLQQIFCN